MSGSCGRFHARLVESTAARHRPPYSARTGRDPRFRANSHAIGVPSASSRRAVDRAPRGPQVRLRAEAIYAVAGLGPLIVPDDGVLSLSSSLSRLRSPLSAKSSVPPWSCDSCLYQTKELWSPRPRKRVWVQAHRGFKSHRHRQPKAASLQVSGLHAVVIRADRTILVTRWSQRLIGACFLDDREKPKPASGRQMSVRSLSQQFERSAAITSRATDE
jgi:hypothetical protein